MSIKQYLLMVLIAIPVAFLIPFGYYSLSAYLSKRRYRRIVEQGEDSFVAEIQKEKRKGSSLENFASDMALRQRAERALGSAFKKLERGESIRDYLLKTGVPTDVMLEVLLKDHVTLRKQNEKLKNENTGLKQEKSELYSKLIIQAMTTPKSDLEQILSYKKRKSKTQTYDNL